MPVPRPKAPPYPRLGGTVDGKVAAGLGLDPDRVSYTALADLATATDKARRDAPAIAVCEA